MSNKKDLEIESLKQEIKRLRAIIDQVPANIYCYENDGHTFSYANKHQQETAKKFNATEKSLQDYHDNTHAKQIEDNNLRVLKEETPLLFVENLTTPDNLTKTFLSLKAPLFDSNKKITGVIGCSFDVTQINKQQETYDKIELFKSSIRRASQPINKDLNTDEQLNDIVDQIPGNIYWKNNKGVYLGANSRATLTMGLTKTQFIGKNINHLLTKTTKKTDATVINTGNPIVTEEFVPHNDSTQDSKVYLSYKGPLLDKQGNIIGLIGNSIDITLQKQYEIQLVTMLAKYQNDLSKNKLFIENLAHDLRTPFANIIGLVTLLKTGERDDKKQLLEQISRTGKQLLQLIDSILLSKINLFEQNDDKNQNIDLKQSINYVTSLTQSGAKQKNIRLVVEAPNISNPIITTNKLSLTRILLNLITNAIKFTEKGSVSIQARFAKHYKEKSTNTLIIIISDTGCGISKKDIPLIFNKNFQGSRTKETSSVGLGLYQVKRLISKLGGSITVDSAINMGSEFTVEIPIFIPNRNMDTTNLTQALNEHLAHKKPVILLVDDDIIAQKVAAQRLEDNLDCNLNLASTATEALKLTKQHKYDAIITDIGLPDLSGDKLAIKIRQQNTYNKKVTIIGLTAHLNKLQMNQYPQINHLKEKPFPDEIIHIIENIATN